MTISKYLDWLNFNFLGNPISDWLIAIGLAATIVLTLSLIKPLLIRRLGALARRTETKLDDSVVKALQVTRVGLLTIIAIHFGIKYLVLPLKVVKFIGAVATVATFLQLGLWVGALLDFWIATSRSRALEVDASAATSIGALSFIGRLVLWTLLILLTLDNLGVNVTALVAGLGVSGIAVALAVQSILGDLFASLSIIVDKPFVVGDLIVIDTYAGYVEHVGLKTTRLRSLGGEQIIMSNSDLLKARVRNYKRMQERRIQLKFGVLYDTTADKLELIPSIVKEIISTVPKTRFERAHFSGFGDSSLDFDIVYWVLDPDYTCYMDIQQTINLALVRRFTEAKIGFAFPTRTLQLDNPLRVETMVVRRG
jgi:small-conductance mechanosensitive channel